MHNRKEVNLVTFSSLLCVHAIYLIMCNKQTVISTVSRLLLLLAVSISCSNVRIISRQIYRQRPFSQCTCTVFITCTYLRAKIITVSMLTTITVLPHRTSSRIKHYNSSASSAIHRHITTWCHQCIHLLKRLQ